MHLLVTDSCIDNRPYSNTVSALFLESEEVLAHMFGLSN